MKFNVHYAEETNQVTGCVSGNIDRETLVEYSQKVKKAVSQHDCRRFLNDLRGAELKLSTMDLYEIPDKSQSIFSSTGTQGVWRRAILASRNLADYRFFESIARGRGHNVKVFTDSNEAMKWLKGRESP